MVRLVARLASRAQTSFSPKCRQYHTFNRDLSEFIIPETEAKRHSTKPLPLPAELIEPYVRRLACNLDIPSRIRCHYLEDSDAFHKWFKQRGKHTTLNTELFKQEGGSSLVPLEYLGFDPESNTPTFKRFKAPLATFASFVEAPSSKFNLYLAQCDFDSFPERLQEDLEFFPRFLRKYSSENHIYGRNIWIGTPPTYTPLHRDPNHNYYQQLASVKKVRLMSPEMGLKVYSKLANDNSNDWASHADPRGRIRTEEMMASSQRQDLYRAVWENQDPTVEIYEGALERGQALFIPAGWWHSFKSEDQNSISASINYWFQFASKNCFLLRDLSKRRGEAKKLLAAITGASTTSLRPSMLELENLAEKTGQSPQQILGDSYKEVMDAEHHFRHALIRWGYLKTKSKDLRSKSSRILQTIN